MQARQPKIPMAIEMNKESLAVDTPAAFVVTMDTPARPAPFVVVVKKPKVVANAVAVAGAVSPSVQSSSV